MNKTEIYNKYASLPKDDGTFTDCFDYYMNHPQTSEDILKRACQEFSEYVSFCMDTSTNYKSKTDGKYKPMYAEDDLDFDDYEIYLFWDNVKIYRDTDLKSIEYPNIKGLIDIYLLNERYAGVFKRLLQGDTFLELEPE